MRDILLVTIVLACSVVALRRPAFGILTFVCLGLLNPHSMTWNLYKNVPLSQIVAVGTIIGYVFSSEPKYFPRQRESFLLLALWGTFGISTLFAIYPDRALERLIYISKILLMVFLATSIIKTQPRVLSLLRVIALSLGFFGLKGGIFSIRHAGNSMILGPEGSFLEANNSIGLALAMNIPLLFYLAKLETRRWLRWIMWAMMVFSYPALVFTYSRGAWLGLAVVTMLILLKSRYRLLLIATVFLLLAALPPFFPKLVPQRLADRYRDLVHYQEEGAAQSRLWNWDFCAHVGMARPMTGGGFDFYSTEAYAAYYPEFLERYPGKVWSCHSVWFTILGEHGIPAFLLWIALLGSYLLSVRQIRAFGQAHAEMAWLQPCADMLQAALMAFLVVGTFLDAAHFDMFYYLIGALVILKEMVRYSEHADATPAPDTITDTPHFAVARRFS